MPRKTGRFEYDKKSGDLIDKEPGSHWDGESVAAFSRDLQEIGKKRLAKRRPPCDLCGCKHSYDTECCDEDLADRMDLAVGGWEPGGLAAKDKIPAGWSRAGKQRRWTMMYEGVKITIAPVGGLWTGGIHGGAKSNHSSPADAATAAKAAVRAKKKPAKKKKKTPAKKTRGGKPKELFPAKPPKGFFPDSKLGKPDVEKGRKSGKITPIPMLSGLPRNKGGPAWKKFFKRHKGRDLDSPTNIMVLPGFEPAFLPGERISGPDKWDLVYRIVDSPRNELALDAHALHKDEYIASWRCVIAPRVPLEKDEMALRMVTAAAIDGARRALTVIAGHHGSKLPDDDKKFDPTPRKYHADIAKRSGANLRGAPLYAEVDWSRKAAVAPNDDFFGAV